MSLSIIISYYKNLENLTIILDALKRQTCRDFEVIVSEDDCNNETKQYIEDVKKEVFFPILLVHQDVDCGFRKNMMLNKSLLRAKYEKIAFIDGDCIPHKNFAKEYIKNIEEGCCCFGRAVMLSEKLSNQVRQKKSISGINFMSILFSKSKKKKDGIYFPLIALSYKKFRGLVGRNWGITKQSLVDVNGFDEDYVRAAVGEDTDIEWRLIKNGIKMKSVKNKAIVYHLFHKRFYSKEDVQINIDLMQKKLELGAAFCVNGLKKPHTNL